MTCARAMWPFVGGLALAVCAAAQIGCDRGDLPSTMGPPKPRLTKAPFDRTPDGRLVDRILLRSPSGVELTLVTYGGALTSLKAPDRAGVLDDVLIGFETLASQMTATWSAGALADVSGNGHPWHETVWAAEPFQNAAGVGVVLSATAGDESESGPAVRATVTYTLTDIGQLIAEAHATTSQPVSVGIAPMLCFNLAGRQTNDARGLELTVPAAQVRSAGADGRPAGALERVEGKPLDFRTAAPIGDRLTPRAGAGSSRAAGGFLFELMRSGPGLADAARLHDPRSGRTLLVSTTESDLFVTDGFLGAGLTADGSVSAYGPHAGVCLAPLGDADRRAAPLSPGKVYQWRTTYTFRRTTNN